MWVCAMFARLPAAAVPWCALDEWYKGPIMSRRVHCDEAATSIPRRASDNSEGMTRSTNTMMLQRTQARLDALIRASRLVSTATAIVMDYKLARYNRAEFGEASDALERAREALKAAQSAQDEIGAMDIKRRYRRKRYDTSGAEATEGAGDDTVVQGRTVREYMAMGDEEMTRIATVLRERVEEASEGVAEAEVLARGKGWGAVHEKCAERMLAMIRENQGVYVKLAQHLAQLDYLVPQEIVDAMKAMLDAAPRSSYDDVRQVIKEELGDTPENLFASFSPEPVASASLAQVHVAYDHAGNKLAVKVQHRGLRETSQGDIDAVSVLVRLVARLFPDFTYEWLVDEIAPNLPLELDFTHEAQNARRAARCFAGDPRVVVPRVHDRLTTKRVLTMDFEEGCNATDLASLDAMNLPHDEVAKLVSQVFTKMIFLDGFVHCDPHAANVLIRSRSGDRNNTPQLVLLDHGLYKELDDEFRLEYARLWQALVLADAKSITDSCERLNAGRLAPLLAAMLTNKPWNEIVNKKMNSLRQTGTASEKAAIRGYAQKYMRQITEVLNRVPRQMLLLFKANDCLRHIDRALGAPVNSFCITAEACADARYREETKRGFWVLLFGAPLRALRAIFVWCKVMLRVRLFRASQGLVLSAETSKLPGPVLVKK